MDDCPGQHSISFSFGFFFDLLIFEGAPESLLVERNFLYAC
jgi:hypothetical protein